MTDSSEVPDRAAGGGRQDRAEEPPKWLTHEVVYTEAVAEACESPAGRSQLRKVVTSAGEVHGWELPRQVARLVPGSREQRFAYGAVAGMFAEQAPSFSAGRDDAAGRPERTRMWRPSWGDLGWSVHLGVRQGVLHEDRAAERLKQLAQLSDPVALVRYGRQLVGRLAAEGVPVNWPVLLRDLRRWPHKRVDIANDWFFSYAHAVAPGGEDGLVQAGAAGAGASDNTNDSSNEEDS
ncbi:type I-E CRISPR-associated protein Cse2/CasB [Kitasatospora sp. NPDC015120]|uniref:type I-E CRISPR-associated protein Cse2/CasB n=1 Tax=Kitasatospora sp. NPDC015120 TaxID=3364023 RepID=UPI0036F47EEC